MNVQNIPHNASLAEIVKYYLPDNTVDIVEARVADLMTEIYDLEKEAEANATSYELLDEADTWKYNLLEEIQRLCTTTGSKVELVKAITLAFDESFVEM